MKGPTADVLMQLVPFVLAWVILAGFAVAIGRRKRVRPVKCVFGAFPLWAVVFLIWLASKTDAGILERLDQLEAKR